MSKFTKGAVLGKGAFGKVFKATSTETGEIVAIKEVNLRDVLPQKNCQVLLKSPRPSTPAKRSAVLRVIWHSV